ncbi:MAG: hypothetical protein IID45_06510, partial [Planctomycetes bacterium]|nr:hypothetical protein [Planctomycetota bacterium]
MYRWAGMLSWRGHRFDDMEAAISMLMRLRNEKGAYAIKRLGIDGTGMGMQMGERLKDRFGHRIEVITFTNSIKHAMATLVRRNVEEKTITLPDGMNFEGAGDALFCGPTLFAGYLIRSDALSMQWVAGEIGCRVIPLQLIQEEFYHLDTCFCPLSETEAIYYPPAFDDYALRALREYVPTLITVEPDEARRFAANAVVIGRDVVLNTGCPNLEGELVRLGYQTHATELGEFIKSGGSAKCLTLRLDGEEAAVWPE